MDWIELNEENSFNWEKEAKNIIGNAWLYNPKEELAYNSRDETKNAAEFHYTDTPLHQCGLEVSNWARYAQLHL